MPARGWAAEVATSRRLNPSQGDSADASDVDPPSSVYANGLNPSQGDSADARLLEKCSGLASLSVSIPLRVIRPMPVTQSRNIG